MGKYSDYYYKVNQSLYSKLEVGNITAQLEFRKRHGCKSFQWYMESVAWDWYLLLKAAFPKVDFD